jgi:hypothetical protein
MAIMLARSGVGKFILIDHNIYSLSDMNRDAGCYLDTLGKYKVEVIKEQILKINPTAKIETVTQTVDLEAISPYIEQCDVFLAQSENLALSVHSIMIAQDKKKLAVAFMPSGMTGYVEMYPPELKKRIDPAVLFGSPAGLSYRQLYYFLRNPLNRCGRRWHITEGKWNITWFQKWRKEQAEEAQICPNLWLGASLACTEIIKQVTGKWERVSVPRMWHLLTADSRVRVGKYRRRSWWFEKFIYWTFSIEWLGIGRKYHKYTAKRLMRELDYIERQEKDGKKVKLPFIWHWI